jgi:prepilin-type N-terminal cleavage/methylation domain-containing protein
MKQQKGLILIELIMTLVLIGIIATFTGFFIFNGINGYLKAKYITNGALDAQRALERISLELRYIEYFTSAPVESPAPDASLTYKNTDLTGTRTFRYDSNNKVILIGTAGSEQPLLENVDTLTLKLKYLDVNGDGSNEVKQIHVGFTIDGIGKRFQTRVFPRNLVPEF